MKFMLFVWAFVLCLVLFVVGMLWLDPAGARPAESPAMHFSIPAIPRAGAGHTRQPMLTVSEISWPCLRLEQDAHFTVEQYRLVGLAIQEAMSGQYACYLDGTPRALSPFEISLACCQTGYPLPRRWQPVER